jgi:hypothetical protein
MNRRGGGKALSRKRASSEHLAHLIVHYRGLKGVKDAVLADICGFTEARQLYRALGQRLLLLSRSCWFELQPSKRGGDEDQARPVNVFTLSGVIMITTWLATERALEVGMALAPLLRTRRRASKNKQRRPPRSDDPVRQAKYQKAIANAYIAWTALEKSIERSFGRLS